MTRYQSVVLYHMNNPTWYEMLKVSLPIEKYYGAHVRFEYRHCSSESQFFCCQLAAQRLRLSFVPAKDKTEKRLLGFSFTPLMDQDGTVLPDGQLQLLVYKCEDAQRLRDVSSYLDLPYSVRQLNGRAPSISGSVSSVNVSSPSNLPFQRNVRESVTVAFYLCSTKLTQNGRSMIFQISTEVEPSNCDPCARNSQLTIAAEMEVASGQNCRYAQLSHATAGRGDGQVLAGRPRFALCHVLH